MTNSQLKHLNATASSADEVHMLRFVDDAVRAARPWMLIAIIAAMIGTYFGVTAPALEEHARGTDGTVIPLGCSLVVYGAGLVFIHLILAYSQDHLTRRVYLV